MLLHAGALLRFNATPRLQSRHHLLNQNLRCRGAGGHTNRLLTHKPSAIQLVGAIDQIPDGTAFAVIAGKDVTPKPSELASGIGIALVNTPGRAPT